MGIGMGMGMGVGVGILTFLLPSKKVPIVHRKLKTIAIQEQFACAKTEPWHQNLKKVSCKKDVEGCSSDDVEATDQYFVFFVYFFFFTCLSCVNDAFCASAKCILQVEGCSSDYVVDFFAAIESMDIKSCKMYRACKKRCWRMHAVAIDDVVDFLAAIESTDMWLLLTTMNGLPSFFPSFLPYLLPFLLTYLLTYCLVLAPFVHMMLKQ